MPAMNISPSPMPASVSNSAPVQASQAANATESSTDNGKQANFANALDGAKAKTQKAESDKGSERDAAEETTATDDPARLAQIAAALLASLGAPVVDQAKSRDAQSLSTDMASADSIDDLGDRDFVLGDSTPAGGIGEPPTQPEAPNPPLPGSALPLDGMALPATAVPAAQSSYGETSPDTSGQSAAADAVLAQSANRTTNTATNDKPNPAVNPLGGAVKQSVVGATTEPQSKDTQTKAIIADSTVASSSPSQTTISPWTDALANRTAEAARTEAPQFPVRTPVSQSGWADDVGNRMVWMAGKELGRAELILTPPHLGRVEITLNVNGDQTTAHFVTATPAAREAIEQSLPRLRELMTDAGLNLSQVNVSANGSNDPSQEQRTWSGGQRGGRQQHADDASELVGQARPLRVQSGLGMVDTFA